MINIIIYIVEILLLVIIGSFILYLLILSLNALKYKSIQTFDTKKYRRFAIIIPAHNEENSISRTVESALKINYPEDLWNLYVIADNCTDKTAEISRELGANVFERTDPNERGKGYALRWCIDKLLMNEIKYDAFVVVDADSIVQPNILQVLNYYLENGSEVVQVADLVEPQYDSWSSEITRLGFTLYNYVRPLGRKQFGFSAGLKGNGMCLSTNVLRKVPWSAWSLNEDLEYGLILLLNEVVVNFAPETLVLAAMPKNPKNAETQRTRWERGRYPVIKNYTPKLLKMFLKKRKLIFFDALVELITPPVVNLFLIITLMILINLLLTIFGIISSSVFIFLWIALFILGLFHIFVGLKAVNADKMLYKALLHIPKYVIWKIYLYINFSIKKFKNEWIRTTRETN